MSSGELTDHARAMLELVREHARSGLTIREFCEQRDLKTATFSWWRRRFRDELDASSQFVEVTATSDDDQLPFVVSSGEYRIEVPQGFDAASLARLLDTVRGC